MDKSMGDALNALKAQVKAGAFPSPDREPVPVERPVKIGEVLANAEEAKDELRHTRSHSR